LSQVRPIVGSNESNSGSAGIDGSQGVSSTTTAVDIVREDLHDGTSCCPAAIPLARPSAASSANFILFSLLVVLIVTSD